MAQHHHHHKLLNRYANSSLLSFTCLQLTDVETRQCEEEEMFSDKEVNGGADSDLREAHVPPGEENEDELADASKGMDYGPSA